MKQIETFSREQLYIYKLRGRDKLSIILSDFEYCFNFPTAYYRDRTYSGPGNDYRAPTCIFFTENVLKDDFLLLSVDFVNVRNSFWVPEGAFLKIGFRLGDKTYEGWICLDRFENVPQNKKEILAQNYPQYFSDESEFKRGFFNENLNEKIDRFWNSDSQIERIMEDDTLSLDDKAHLLFDRTPEHVFNFGSCSFTVSDAVEKIAEENGGTTYVDARATYLPAKGSVDVATVMCLRNMSEPFNLQQSWDYYVKQRPAEYRDARRSYGFRPREWYNYLKAVIETFEEAVKYTEAPSYKRGFFNEENQNTLKEEMEKKVIGSGHGWRIVCRDFKSVSWDRTRYKPGVVVVRLPNSRHNFFMCTPVVTEGVSGQPQLTFDDPAKAQEYCDKLNRISNARHWEITKTRNNYECYKIPLASGGEAWLATSNFPSQGSPKWKELCDLFPEYFKNVTRGFFTESIDTNFTEDEVEAIMTSDMDGEEKSQKLFNRPEEYVTHVQFLCLNTTSHNITYLKEHNYLTQEALDLDLSELHDRLNRIADGASRNAGNENRGGTLTDPNCLTVKTVFWYGGFIDSLDKSWEHYVDNKRKGYYWYKYIKHCINEIEKSGLIQASVPVKRGFFDESLADGNPSVSEIEAIVNNETLSNDKVCEKLFGGRNHDYILNACYHHCARYKAQAPDGKSTPSCDRLSVTCPFIINNFSEPVLNIRESYQAYVEGKAFNGETRWRRASAYEWWEDIVKLYTFWEQHDPENFTGPTNHVVRGFFNEGLKKEE